MWSDFFGHYDGRFGNGWQKMVSLRWVTDLECEHLGSVGRGIVDLMVDVDTLKKMLSEPCYLVARGLDIA